MKAAIRILHLISSAEIAGGERYLYDLITYSNKQFRHIVALPYHGPFESLLKKAGYDYLIIDLQKKFSIKALYLIRNLIKEKNIHILHTHGYRANFCGRLACLFMKVKNIATVHVSLFDYRDTPILLRYLYIFFEFVLSFKTSKFICISNAMARDMRRIGISNKKIALINNGIDLDRFYPKPITFRIKKDLGIEQNTPLIGTIGRMVTEKGQIYLLEALKYIKEEINDLRCLIVGEGPMLSYLQKKTCEFGVRNLCIFAGHRNDVELIYPILDIFILPSLREPFGLVLLEAMACEIPVIATNKGGPLDFIDSGVNGVLVAPNDARSLAKEIIHILSNKSKAKLLAEEGLKTVKNKFDIKKQVMELEKAYSSLCNI